MPTCKYCDREFATAAALGGHVRKRHPEGMEPEQAAKRSYDTHCPICDFEIPFTNCWPDQGMTVCPECITMFNKSTKEVYSERGAKLRELGVLPPIAR